MSDGSYLGSGPAGVLESHSYELKKGEEGLLELRDGPEHLRRVGEHVDDRVVDARRL